MLSIQNIHVTVENKEVVKGVSFAVKPGEIHALMGPNGSGKSSLAMAIAGHPRYEVAAKGQGPRAKGQRKAFIELDGENITDKTPDQRARMGLFLAMQYPVEVEGVTVEQLLRRSVQEKLTNEQIHKRTKKRTNLKTNKPIDVLEFRKKIEKLAAAVGVSKELLRRSVNVGFSGGEKKRLEILQMLVLQPKYAILDETDSGLDVDAMRIIARSVRLFANSKLKTQNSKAQVKSQNRPGILVITHYARLLKHLKPDVVHVMKEGKIVESGGKELAEKVERKGYGGNEKK